MQEFSILGQGASWYLVKGNLRYSEVSAVCFIALSVDAAHGDGMGRRK